MSSSYISPEDFQSLTLEKEKLEQKLNDLNQIIESISSGLENPINQIINLANNIGNIEYQKRTVRIAINALSKYANSLNKSKIKSTTKSTETTSPREAPFKIGDIVRAKNKSSNLKFEVVKVDKRGKGWRVFEDEENFYRSSELTLAQEGGMENSPPVDESIPQNSETPEKSVFEELPDPWDSEVLETPTVAIETPVIEPPVIEPQKSEVLETSTVTIEPQESEVLETSTIATTEPPVIEPQESEMLETPPVIEPQESEVLETPPVTVEPQESEEEIEEIEEETPQRTELPDGLYVGKGIKYGLNSLRHQDLMNDKLPHINTYNKKEWLGFAQAAGIPTMNTTREILRNRLCKHYQEKCNEDAGKQLNLL